MRKTIPFEALSEPAEAVLGLTDSELAIFLQAPEESLPNLRESPGQMTEQQVERARCLTEMAQVMVFAFRDDAIQPLIRDRPVPRLNDRTYIEAITNPELEPTFVLDLIRLGALLEPHNYGTYEQISSTID